MLKKGVLGRKDNSTAKESQREDPGEKEEQDRKPLRGLRY